MLAVAFAVGCSPPPGAPGVNVDRGDSPLLTLFQRAAEQSGVPVDVLLAVAYIETRFSHHPDLRSHADGYGLMHLRDGHSLQLAATLLRADPATLRRDRAANVRGAALLIAELARRRSGGVLPARPADFYQALVDYSGYRDAAAQHFASRVLSVVRDGARGQDDQGKALVVAPHPGLERGLPPWIGSSDSALRPDYGNARWVGPACSTSSRSGSVKYVVVHTCQGGFSGCWSWLKGCNNVSAHYVVSSGGSVVQLVEERIKAWHVGCLNSSSVGIEHEGYAQDPGKWYTDKMYCASAKLTASICKRLGIPCDRKHVIGHVEANKMFCKGSHWDPGNGWDWNKYMGYVRNGCGKPAVPQVPKLSISVTIRTIGEQKRDLCERDKSKGVFDWFVGQTATAHVDVKNSGTAVAKNTSVGIWSQQPYLKVTRFGIYSDWKNNGTFKLNDTDGMQKVARENPGKSFSLWLAALSPGETKRVELKVEATRFSLGVVDHPDLRVWVKHVDNFYEKSSFGTKPNNVGGHQKQNGGDLKAVFQTDVLDKETCDKVDNDCDGKIDNDCAAPSLPITGFSVASGGGGGGGDSGSGGQVGGANQRRAIKDGCAVGVGRGDEGRASGEPAPLELPLLLALALFWRRARRRRHRS